MERFVFYKNKIWFCWNIHGTVAVSCWKSLLFLMFLDFSFSLVFNRFCFTENPLLPRFHFPRIRNPRIFSGILLVVSIGSIEPIKVAKWGLNPQILVTKVNFFVIYDENDDFKCNLSVSTGSEFQGGPLKPMFQFARISLPADFPFPQTSAGREDFLYND